MINISLTSSNRSSNKVYSKRFSPYDTEADDGYSGMDFQRPEFKRMIEDLSSGTVNCIIVKDLSRFGRDYIEVGRWLQKKFPALGIRFIAIADRYDSKTATGSETSLILPIKNFINDSYCRDISQKVKSHQQIKREKGEFIGAFAVYGYMKSKENPKRFAKDPYAAEVVRCIYQWRLSGLSMFAIAEHLNQAGILSPMEYKRFHGEHYYTGFASSICAQWSAAAVKRILEDETYTGVLVQGKGERISYKVKKSIPKKREDWIRVPDCHEAIITKEEYDMVQRLLHIPARAKKDTGRAHILTGLLFCADCKKPLIRRKNCYKGQEKVFYICSTKNKGLGCSRHSIEEQVLLEYLERIREKSKVQMLSWESKFPFQLSDKVWKEELEKLEKYKESFEKLCLSLEKNVMEGVLTKEEAVSLFFIYKKQEKKIEEIIARQRNFKWKEESDLEAYICRKQNFFMIERIEVGEEKKVVFILKNGERHQF